MSLNGRKILLDLCFDNFDRVLQSSFNFVDTLDALFLRSNTALVSYSILKRSETRNLYPGLIDF